MKLLKLRVPSGYKMLEKGFEINFLTKTRINKDSNNDDLIELTEGLFYPKETVFVGKNSSGKTTVLELVYAALQLVSRGRILSKYFIINDDVTIEFIAYHNHKLYKYIGTFIKPLVNEEYLIIKDESLFESEYRKNHNKDLSNVNFKRVNDFVSSVDTDTSNVYRYFNRDELNIFVSLFEDMAGMFDVHIDLFKNEYSLDTFMKLVHVFDDSIESIDAHYDESGNKTSYYDFKRVNEDKVLVTSEVLSRILSKGTVRGINLYATALLSFKTGGTIIVDELEKNFNKNLISNLILMFNDPTINKANASIIYSTHYSELLDETDRCDNINVLHRNGNTITLKNMCTDYNTRTDMLKSNQFDQNAFDNNVNYNLLAELKKELRK